MRRRADVVVGAEGTGHADLLSARPDHAYPVGQGLGGNDPRHPQGKIHMRAEMKSDQKTRRNRRRVGVLTASALLCSAAPVALAAVTPTDDGVTTLVTKGRTAGTYGNGTSTRARISGNGQYVTYQSAAQNLTSERRGGPHVYLTDLSGKVVPGANNTVLVDADATTGVRCMTKDGKNGQSTFNEVSNQRGGDGPWVVFSSNCANLVPGWAHTGDVYLYNARTKAVQVVSQANGNDALPIGGVSTRPVISDDGRYVSWNTTSGDIYVRDMLDQSARRSVKIVNSQSTDDESLRPEISSDGSHVIFASDAQLAPGDTNTSRNVYLIDLRAWQADKTRTSFTPVLVDAQANGVAAPLPSSRPGINGDGTIVTFQSRTGLVPDDKNNVLDAYWRNMVTGETVLLSRGMDGTVPRGQSSRPQVDDSGYVAAFVSTSNAFVKGDRNGRPDAFIRKLTPGNPTQGTTFLVSQRPDGDPGGDAASCSPTPVAPLAAGGTRLGGALPMARPGNSNISTRPYLSADGSRVVFVSGMCDLVNPTTDGADNQIFVRTYGPGGPTAG